MLVKAFNRIEHKMTSKHIFSSIYWLKNGYKHSNKSLNNFTLFRFSSQSHDSK